jgi:amidase
MKGTGVELLGLGARALSERIASGAISPVDLMRETLTRIGAVNRQINAVVSLRDREVLMGEARMMEAELRARGPRGWLHGIPVAVKDLVDVKGLPTTRGAPFLAGAKAQADAGMVASLRAAGAIVIGKTNVPMFGLGSHSTNPVFGVTRNPFDLSRTAGGSSGGAAAALATGMVSVADGSDMMGSLRNPAAWCDVYGFRHTVGLIPKDDADAVLSHRLSTLGPMAREVGDLAALLSTMSGGAFEAIGRAPARPRIGWLGDWGGAPAMEDGILAHSEAALSRMTEAGWTVEPVAPPVPRDMLWDSWTTLRSFAVAQELGPHWRDPHRRAGLNAQAAWEVGRGLAVTGGEVERAAALRTEWLGVLEGLFARFDALALPATQVWPFAAEADWPREIAGQAMDTYHRWMEVVVPASLAGVPVLGLPAGVCDNGLPCGVQLMGPSGSDAMLLALARSWEEVAGPRSLRL